MENASLEALVEDHAQELELRIEARHILLRREARERNVSPEDYNQMLRREKAHLVITDSELLRSALALIE